MNRRCLHCMNEFQVPQGYENTNLCCPTCGYTENTPPKEVYHLYPGTVLQGRYVIGTTLGYGGFGVTYKAWDEFLKTVVAIKEYYPAGMARRAPGMSVVEVDLKTKDEYRKGLSRFLDEARNTAKFKNTPNIVDVDNFFEENNTAYYVMEYLQGMTLRGYLNQGNGAMDCASAVNITMSVIAALKDVHKAGFLHRDISPDNIFLCEGGVVKVIDFGAASFSDEDNLVTRSIILKPGFAPLEQYNQKSKQGPWTDIYAISATLYKMVTGVVPDESPNRAIEDTVVSPMELNPDIPEYLSNTIMKGMALEPNLRFKNLDDFSKALENKKKVVDLKLELKRRKQKRALQIASAVILVLAGGVIAYSMYHQKKKTVILDKADISIWLRIDNDETEEDCTQMLEDMCSQFLEDQPAITIETRCIPAEDYDEELEAAYESGDMPTIYESDNVSDELLSCAENTDAVFDYLDEYIDLDETCYFLSDDEDELKEGCFIPLGFNVPVVYVRRGNNIDLESVSFSGFDDVESGSYYVDEDYSDMVVQTLGEYTNSISDDTAAMQSFVDGEIVYYIATVKEFTSFNDAAAGLYEMRPISADAIYGEFTDCMSINSNAAEKERIAAEMLLYYMLLDKSQKTMHVSNKNNLPLNVNALKQLMENNGKYEIIEEYIDKLSFELP